MMGKKKRSAKSLPEKGGMQSRQEIVSFEGTVGGPVKQRPTMVTPKWNSGDVSADGILEAYPEIHEMQ